MMFEVQSLSKFFSKKYYPQTEKHSQGIQNLQKERIYHDKKFSEIRLSSTEKSKIRRIGADRIYFSENLFTVPDQLSSIPYRSNNNSQSISEEFIKSNNEKESGQSKINLKKNLKENKIQVENKDETVPIRTQTVKSILISTSKQIIKSSQINNRLRFMYETIPNNKILKLLINRNKNGLNLFWPQYNAIFANDGFCLANMKKKISAAASSYLIFTNSVDQQQDQQQMFVGKLKNYLMKSVYNIVNEGLNPNKATEKDKIRQVIATIKCTSYLENKNILRKLQVYILNPKFRFLDLKRNNIYNEQATLDKLYEQNADKIILLKNRKPIWSEKNQGYLMDFSGRIQMASVKNFILQNQKNEEVLMFGKIKQDQFSLQVNFPISPIVGLGIICANIDFKIGYTD